ncbi:GNAT family protein [Streptomyces hirsutus]
MYTTCPDSDIQRWTTVPSPYLPGAAGLHEAILPDGWASGSMFTFGLFLPSGELTGMLGITMRILGVGEIGYWGVKEHRRGAASPRPRSPCGAWAFANVRRPRGMARRGRQPALRAVAERAGFVLEGTLRSSLNNKGVLRNCSIASCCPSDLGLASTVPYCRKE